jgi:hypothetical protein
MHAYRLDGNHEGIQDLYAYLKDIVKLGHLPSSFSDILDFQSHSRGKTQTSALFCETVLDACEILPSKETRLQIASECVYSLLARSLFWNRPIGRLFCNDLVSRRDWAWGTSILRKYYTIVAREYGYGHIVTNAKNECFPEDELFDLKERYLENIRIRGDCEPLSEALKCAFTNLDEYSSITEPERIRHLQRIFIDVLRILHLSRLF